MTTTGGDILIERLIDWGVEVVFGLPGDGINGIMEALRRRQDRIRFVQVRHEEASAFMACGYAKFTGKLGVCLATSGPGGIHLLNGLYDAKLDGQPVLAITGLQYHDLIGTYTQQDVELDKLFVDVARYNARIMGSAHIENVVDLAARTALTHRGVAHLTFPVDLQSAGATRSGSERNVPFHSAAEYAHSARLPDDGELKKAAEILNGGDKVTILAGRGALGAGDMLEQVAEKLAAPAVKALLGKAALPGDNPYTTGGIGLLGTRPSQEAMANCDTLLIVGSSFPYIEYLPEPGQARCVQIELDPARLGLRYPVDVGLIGDSGRTLEALLPLLDEAPNRTFLEAAQKGMEDWRALMKTRGTNRDRPMKPQVVAWELGQRLADDAIVAADSGTVTTWWARQIPARGTQMHSVSGNLASMANSLPYAMAAQIAYPDRQCISFVGDGGFTMLMGEFATCVKYGLPIKIIVVKNNSLGQIKWEQLAQLGNPEFGCELHPIDFAAFARACGGSGFSVDDPVRCGDVIEEGLSTAGPVIIEAAVDPNEPPLPPKVTTEQALNLAEALAKGTKDAADIARTLAVGKVRELI